MRSRRSAVSRRFVALSTERLRELSGRPIGDRGIGAVLIDGIVSRPHDPDRARGDGRPTAETRVAPGDDVTENATVANSLLPALIDRGLKRGTGDALRDRRR